MSLGDVDLKIRAELQRKQLTPMGDRRTEGILEDQR